jgi:hypothetical protein
MCVVAACRWLAHPGPRRPGHQRVRGGLGWAKRAEHARSRVEGCHLDLGFNPRSLWHSAALCVQCGAGVCLNMCCEAEVVPLSHCGTCAGWASQSANWTCTWQQQVSMTEHDCQGLWLQWAAHDTPTADTLWGPLGFHSIGRHHAPATRQQLCGVLSSATLLNAV